MTTWRTEYANPKSEERWDRLIELAKILGAERELIAAGTPVEGHEARQLEYNALRLWAKSQAQAPSTHITAGASSRIDFR